MAEEGGQELASVREQREGREVLSEERIVLYELPRYEGVDLSNVRLDAEGQRSCSDAVLAGETMLRDVARSLPGREKITYIPEGGTVIELDLLVEDEVGGEKVGMREKAASISIAAGLHGIDTAQMRNQQELQGRVRQEYNRRWGEGSADHVWRASVGISACAEIMRDQAQHFTIDGKKLTDEEIGQTVGYFKDVVGPLAIATTIASDTEAKYPLSEGLVDDLKALGTLSIEAVYQAGSAEGVRRDDVAYTRVDALVNHAWATVVAVSQEPEETGRIDVHERVDKELDRVLEGHGAPEAESTSVMGFLSLGKKTAKKMVFADETRRDKYTGRVVEISKDSFDHNVAESVDLCLRATDPDFYQVASKARVAAGKAVSGDSRLQRSLAILKEDFGEALVDKRRGASANELPTEEEIIKLAVMVEAGQIVKRITEEPEVADFLQTEVDTENKKEQRIDEIQTKRDKVVAQMNNIRPKGRLLLQVPKEMRRLLEPLKSQYDALELEETKIRESFRSPTVDRLAVLDKRKGSPRAGFNESADIYLELAGEFQDAELAGDRTRMEQLNGEMSQAVLYMLGDSRAAEAAAKKAESRWFAEAPIFPGPLVETDQGIDCKKLYGVEERRRRKGYMGLPGFANAATGGVIPFVVDLFNPNKPFPFRK